MKKTHTIRSIAELANVPEGDLPACVAALHRGIVEAKRQHAAALREGLVPADTAFEFQTFVWKPTGSREPFSALSATLGPETPISELPVRPRVRFVLHQKNVFCLEDLSATSENELLRGEGLGVKTVGRLRELLRAIGLDFLPNPDPRGRALDESRALRALPGEILAATLRGLPDRAPVSLLGLRGPTLGRAHRAGYKTVGELRATPARDLAMRFGRSERQEIYKRLAETGRTFQNNHTASELWRIGFIDRDDIPFPKDAGTLLVDLQPWLGSAFKSLKRRGVATLGELRAAAARNELADISGIGDRTAEKLTALLLENA
ncbi:helix-hairpin-helix domain-containing protein [Variovorax sp. S2]|uniref:helix-hairpin-helix domain-containing protein n=1 Tax=Variovorax sp. S12S4 TaxID=3029170 RepID=UPI00215CD994|nr:helix-hairpin-helix domain-containing protein [Variovorax sp. S12S4]MCR8960557.1 helix-hairpin-helix domain-containing protein [Variovorax sp. S12S4]